MAGFYDLVLMIDPTAPEERRTAAVSEAESMINSGGELVSSHDWGLRRMAYEINHRPEAEYRLYQFNGDNALLERLGQRLRIMDGVLRFRIIKVKPGQPTPPPPDQQAARRRDDREPQDTKVAARAAADAPAVGAPAADAAPADAPAADAPAGPPPAADAPPATDAE
jgi:small subunit ribosomal protein S6